MSRIHPAMQCNLISNQKGPGLFCDRFCAVRSETTIAVLMLLYQPPQYKDVHTTSRLHDIYLCCIARSIDALKTVNIARTAPG